MTGEELSNAFPSIGLATPHWLLRGWKPPMFPQPSSSGTTAGPFGSHDAVDRRRNGRCRPEPWPSTRLQHVETKWLTSLPGSTAKLSQGQASQFWALEVEISHDDHPSWVSQIG